MPVFEALVEVKEEDEKNKATLGYIVRLRLSEI